MIRLRQLVPLFLLFAALTSAVGAERILNYQSEIMVNTDSTMTVKETITAVAEGNQIKRGIYRDFPTTYRDRFGHAVRVRFKVLSVTRNGQHIPYLVKDQSNGKRVYMGSMSQTIPPGEYVFSLTY